MVQANRKIVDKEVMDNIRRHISSTVGVEYTNHLGDIVCAQGKLLDVCDFRYIEIEPRSRSGSTRMLFFADVDAIRLITSNNGILYDNRRNVSGSYDVNHVDEVREKTFGKEMANIIAKDDKNDAALWYLRA